MGSEAKNQGAGRRKIDVLIEGKSTQIGELTLCLYACLQHICMFWLTSHFEQSQFLFYLTPSSSILEI
jgi:hypothetical protein